MKLYDSKTAPNPRRVRIFLAEKGITVPTEQVDIGNKQNRTPEYAKMNPMMGVPVLQLDDGSYLAETVAICRYFEGLQPEPSLFGRTPKEMGMIEMWNRRMEFNVLAAIANAFRHTNAFFAGRIEQVQAFGEIQAREAVAALDWLDSELAKTRFIAGDQYSIADITALCGVDFGRVVKIRVDPDKQKNLARWHAEVSSRPSAKA